MNINTTPTANAEATISKADANLVVQEVLNEIFSAIRFSDYGLSVWPKRELERYGDMFYTAWATSITKYTQLMLDGDDEYDNYLTRIRELAKFAFPFTTA